MGNILKILLGIEILAFLEELIPHHHNNQQSLLQFFLNLFADLKKLDARYRLHFLPDNKLYLHYYLCLKKEFV